MKPLLGSSRRFRPTSITGRRNTSGEINGQRSGFVGVGPRARSVESDQLPGVVSEARG